MKVLVILLILVTLALIFVLYSRDKNLKKFLLSLVTFALILSLGVIGNLTRSVMPLFMAHLILLIISWGALIVYLFKARYYWWILFSPVITIGLFLLLESISGSRT